MDVASRAITSEISLNVPAGGETFADSDAMDVKASADGAFLYCADVTNFRVAVIDTARKRVVGSIRVGRYPYALAVAGPQVYVANIGMFEYRPVPPPSDRRYDARGLTFPAFGFPSKEAREGVSAEGFDRTKFLGQ